MEIEVKLKYKNKGVIIAWLKQNGFKLTENKEIRDSYFGLGCNSMADIDCFYRIRNVVGKLTELTLKDAFQNKNGIVTRREINIAIDDPDKMMTVLKSLKCLLIKENFSKREIWEKGEIRFEFINFSKPAKLNIIEIEGPDNEIIETLIKDLGDKVEVAGNEIFSVFDTKS